MPASRQADGTGGRRWLVPSSTAAKPKLAQKYPTWGAWVDSGDWAKTSPTGTLTLPANASEIMILALDPDVSVTQLARVTSRDQVLAARMLRLANSAYCAPLQEITTISEAVVRLGTASVRNVVLATCMASRLQSGNTYGAHGRGLAAHGIGTAFLAQLVARVAIVNQEEAFLYGLVHDIGKLLVLQLSKDYVRGGGKAPSDDEVQARDRRPARRVRRPRAARVAAAARHRGARGVSPPARRVHGASRSKRRCATWPIA